jgi:hypothetical protein
MTDHDDRSNITVLDPSPEELAEMRRQQDATPTLVRCPVCAACAACLGEGMVTTERAEELRREVVHR